MVLQALAQIAGFFDVWTGAINFNASSSSNNVTAAITTVLSTAGRGGVSVPLQVAATAESIGLVTAAADNRVEIWRTSDGAKIAASGNEVYGRLTEAGGVYTLSYFTSVGGTETVYTFPSATSIDFYFSYRYDLARIPTNFATRLVARNVSQDPAGTGSGSSAQWFPEKRNVTALNTIDALTKTPTSATNVFLIVNGKTENAFGGGSAAFSVNLSTKAITWNAANAQYALQTGMDVIAFYLTAE